jgi:hypothetical protein
VPAEWPDDPNDPGAWLNHGDALAADTAAWEGVPARGGRSAGTRRGRETARSRVRERTHIASPRPGSRGLRTPSALGGSDLLADSVALTLLAVGLLSLVIMALSLAVRIGSLPPSLVLHVDAFGDPDRWGAPRVLLRLPLLAAMTTILNVVLAWFLSPIERFASRFLLAAALVVQLITWVALLDFI